MAEGGSRTVLVRRGWAADMLKPGDHIVVKGNPSRDGSNILHVEWLTTPDGRELFAEDVDPSAVATAAGRRRSAKQE
jgi:hydrogenase maturation factor